MAQELPVKKKYREVVNGHHMSRSGNSNLSKHRGEKDKTRLVTAQEQTRRNQKILVLAGGRKRTWRRAQA